MMRTIPLSQSFTISRAAGALTSVSETRLPSLPFVLSAVAPAAALKGYHVVRAGSAAAQALGCPDPTADADAQATAWTATSAVIRSVSSIPLQRNIYKYKLAL